MSRVPLGDEETRIIFTEEARSGLAGLDAGEQEAVLRKLLDVVTRETPPSSIRYEQIANLDIYVFGSSGRLYTKAVDEIPRGNTEYHVLFLFHIDPNHEYSQQNLAEYSRRAEARADAITSLETVSDVETYLEEHDALDADDLRDLLP